MKFSSFVPNPPTTLETSQEYIILEWNGVVEDVGRVSINGLKDITFVIEQRCLGENFEEVYRGYVTEFRTNGILYPDTNYSFKMKILSGNSESQWSDIVTARTLKAPPNEEALMKLIKFGTAKKVKDLAFSNPGMTLHYPTEKLATPLTRAIDRGDAQILSVLLERIPTLLDMTTTQPCGKTALMHASYGTRSTDILQLLIKKGADLNKRDIKGWNCLYYAVVGEKVRNVNYLLDAGAEINSRDQDGRTPLMIAVILSNFDVLSLLLDRGADTAARDNDGCTALHLAILRKKRDAAVLLLERGSDVDHVSSLSQHSIHELTENMLPDLYPVIEVKKKHPR